MSEIGIPSDDSSDLASEWMTRCKALSEPAKLGEVQTLRDQLAARATGKLSECGKTFGDLVRDGCGDDKTCELTGQRWATRCSKTDGTPLVMRILQRAVERRQEQGAGALVLDPRRRRRQQDAGVRPDHRGRRLEEDQRLVRQGVAELLGVVGIVPADRDDLRGQDRRQQPHV